MKIIFFIPSFKTGGGNRVMIELANQAVQSGLQASILYPNNSSDTNTFFVDNRVEVISIGKIANSSVQKIKNLICTIRYLKAYKKENYLIYTDPIHSVFLGGFKSKSFRFIQADDYSIFDDGYVLKNKYFIYLYKFFCKRSYKRNVGYIFNSEFTYNQFIINSKRRDVPFLVVHPAIDHTIFKESKKGTEQINLAIVGRVHPLKGLSTFYSAWERLAEVYKERVNKVFIISHDDLSGFSRPEKIEIVRPKNDREIAQTLQDSHIFISTSWREGFGLPGLEAMSCGCAVITSCSGGIDEYAVHNINCLKYKPKDINGLLQHLILLLSNNEKIIELSDEAILSSEKFTWQNSFIQLLKILEKQ